MSITMHDIPAIATGAGVFLAAYELRQAKQSLRDGFERSFVDRYERIIARIDLDVILGRARPDPSDPIVRRAFFDYFLLCEEELYYRAFRRVSSATWNDWWYGMRSHLVTDVFHDAFNEICVQAERPPDDDPSSTLHKFGRLSKAVEHRHNSATFEPEKATFRQRLG